MIFGAFYTEFEFSAVDKICGFGMAPNVNVGHSGASHKRYNKSCAFKLFL
jgi:hypothetical protein